MGTRGESNALGPTILYGFPLRASWFELTALVTNAAGFGSVSVSKILTLNVYLDAQAVVVGTITDDEADVEAA